MIRVLHLSGSTPDFQTARLMAALRPDAGSSCDITTRTIGHGGDYRDRHFAAFDLRVKKIVPFDLIHAFDLIALKTTVTTGRVIFSPAQLPDRQTIARLSGHMEKWPLNVVCTSLVEQRVYAAHGISPGRCHVIPPGIDFAGLAKYRNVELRAELGFAADDQVFLLPGESDVQSGHRNALWTISILHVLYPNCRALVWGRGGKIDILERLSQKLRQPKLLTLAERKLRRRVEFDALLSVSDAALFVPDGPTSLLPLALCMAAGLPIVAGDSPLTGDFLQDGRNAALVSHATPRRLAQRIVELRADPAFSASIAETAREDAKQKFAIDRVVDAYRSIYHQIASGVNATAH